MHSKMLWLAAIASLFLATGTAKSAETQQQSEKPAALTPAIRPKVLASIKTQLQEHFFNTSLTPAILARLLQAEESGRYATADPVLFAKLVTEDMQTLSADSHLFLSFHPDWYRAATQPADPKEAADQTQYENTVARSTNFGITESRVLVGNVRYLKIEGFSWIDGEGVKAYEAAMSFLREGRAAIIDLRGNRGGNTVPAYYLLSHLLPADELMYTWHSPGKPDIQLRSSPYLPNGRLTDTPLYILVNSRTRSAAEAIAYDVRQFKLGEVVGEQTEGAANPSDDFAVAPYFRLSIPVMYPEDPISHSNWEGVGVKPSIATASAKAFDVAYGLALDKLLEGNPDGEEQLFLNWAKSALAAKADPFNPGADELLSLTGTYGEYRIELRSGLLLLLRESQQPMELKLVGGPGLFEATEDFMFRAMLQDGELVVLQLGRNPVTFKRSSLPK